MCGYQWMVVRSLAAQVPRHHKESTCCTARRGAESVRHNNVCFLSGLVRAMTCYIICQSNQLLTLQGVASSLALVVTGELRGRLAGWE